MNPQSRSCEIHTKEENLIKKNMPKDVKRNREENKTSGQCILKDTHCLYT